MRISPPTLNFPRYLGMWSDAWYFLSEDSYEESIERRVRHCKYVLDEVEEMLPNRE